MEINMEFIVFIVESCLCVYILNYVPVYCWIQIQKFYNNSKLRSNDEANTFTIDLKNRNRFVNILKNYLQGLEMLKINQIGKIPCHNLRMILYRLMGMKVEKKVVIYGGCEFRGTSKIDIGEGTVIGNKCSIDGRNGIYIGKNVNMSTGVSIWTEQHDSQDSYFACNPLKRKEVVIEDRAWLSNNCIVLPGVKIGEGAVVAAGAVVTKNVGAFEIWGGVPAKKLGDRNHDLKYEFMGDHLWFV